MYLYIFSFVYDDYNSSSNTFSLFFRQIDVLGREAGDRVSDGHVKKHGKEMSPSNMVGTTVFYFWFLFYYVSMSMM